MKYQALLTAMLAARLTAACPAIRPPQSHTSSSTTVVPAVTPVTTPSVPAVTSEPAPTSSSELVADPTPESTTTTPVAVDDPVPATTLVTSVAPAQTTTTSVTAPSAESSSTTTSDSAAVSGESTFYGGNLAGGMCSFSTYTLPAGLYGTAFSGSAWDSAANCGACVKVTGPNGNSITAMIVDQCPECDAGHLDLFQDAFEQLGDLSAGIISTSYTFVPCGITSPIVLHNKSGTSAYWFSMQVVNANEPVAKLEVSTDGGSTWQATTRQSYNFFENSSGFGTSSVDVRVTSQGGKTIVVNGVSVASDSQVTAGSNF
ncbi:Rare lipoprotein A [Pleurostoma richardsiae]|uniref:Rare lipoprotein A n=1 Tax=Pleurostoma richardsiae TaxID=41990 RepID=A0AA38RJJ6_9PEZI|nr:Rare lipoprotein A [Pleurostoma richardsiae]